MDLTILERGGAVILVIGGLSVLTLAIILWKLWQLTRLGAWSSRSAEQAVSAWRSGNTLPQGRGLRYRVVAAAIAALKDHGEDDAREETERVGRNVVAEARAGLRALDVIATVAPLLGLLGTVLGMIAAFQALQDSGAQADPSTLAGGIWEALLTTAAGMGVAIPAAVAVAWFDSVADSIARDTEDLATRVFLARR